MKKIGLIGGLGPESTLDYYRLIMQAFHHDDTIQDYPEVIIYSANPNELIHLLSGPDLDGMTAWLLERIESLALAGAEFGAIGSNTPHVVFDRLAESSILPLVSIVEETCSHCVALGLKRPGLLGTRFTMQSSFYAEVFNPAGLDIQVPGPMDQEYIQEKLDQEIEKGVFKEETRQDLLEIVARMKEDQGIDSVILGCTELPLILTEDHFGLPFINTTLVHVKALIARCQEG